RLVPGDRLHHPDAHPAHEHPALARTQDADRAPEGDRADGVRWPHRLLPDRRAQRTRAAVAGHEGETPYVALPVTGLEADERLDGRPQLPTTDKEVTMKLRVALSVFLAATLALGAWSMAPAQDKTMFVPLLVYRTGPYAPSGTPIANAASDYLNLLNE